MCTKGTRRFTAIGARPKTLSSKTWNWACAALAKNGAAFSSPHRVCDRHWPRCHGIKTSTGDRTKEPLTSLKQSPNGLGGKNFMAFSGDNCDYDLNVGEPQTLARAAGGISLLRIDKDGKMTINISLERQGHTASPVKVSPLLCYMWLATQSKK